MCRQVKKINLKVCLKLVGRTASPNNEKGWSYLIQNPSNFLPIQQGYLTAF